MPIRVTMHIHCKQCNARLARIDDNTEKAHPHNGFVLDDWELENVTIANLIVHCQYCNTGLGIQRIDNNRLIIFGKYLALDALILTKSK